MTPRSPSEAPGDAYSVLLKFLYRAPVAMVQTGPTGEVELMTPLAVNYLLPLSADGRVDNLLTVLEPRTPGLTAQALRPSPADGVVCARLRFVASVPTPRTYEVDGRHVGGGRLHWTLSDVTAEVQAQAAERAALVDQIQRLTADLTTAVHLTGIVMLRTPLPRSTPSGDTPDGLSAFHSLIRAEDQPAFAQDLARAESDGGGEIREFAVRTPTGLRWMVGRHSVYQTRGESADLLTLCLDVTGEHEAALARQARQAAEAANATKTAFLLGLGHELRTPLNGVMGLCEHLLSRPPGDMKASHRDTIAKIHDAGSHLASLLEDLLDVGAIEQGRMTLRPQAVDVQAVIQAALDDVRPLAARRQVSLMPAAALDRPFVTADRTRLRQVLTNLLSNAVKYNLSGGRVEVFTASERGRVTIVVRDSGLGMTSQQLDQLFAPFNRLGREHSAIGGMGLGLYLSKRLVEAMGGTIGVDSRPGEGSTFRVELAGVAPEASHDTSPLDGVAVSGLPTIELLCVDDNPVNLAVYEGFCADRAELQLRTTSLGAEFLAEARRRPPDVAVLDLRLTDMTGWQILEVMRADPVLRAVPVIVCSGSLASTRPAHPSTLTDVSFLSKPVGMAQFLTEVHRLAATSRNHDGPPEGDGAPRS